MDRQTASKLLRDCLDANNLQSWHIRMLADINKPFLGLCSYRDKCVILNALHVDTHPDEEIRNTIFHEVAHALVGSNHAHDDVWAAVARRLGCDNTSACANFSLSPQAIDAIRSGAQLEIGFETEVIRRPTYKITKLQDKCEKCGKVAKEVKVIEIRSGKGRKRITTLECGHIVITDADSQSPFEDLILDGDSNCSHKFVKYECTKCNAKQLRPYQITACREIERANLRFADFDDMGLGKTIVALAVLHFHPEAFKLLWVTKSATKFQHARESFRFNHQHGGMFGRNNPPQIIMTGKETPLPFFKWYVVSYDIFRRTGTDVWKAAGINCIVLDECQAIKNVDATRTQLVRQIAKETTRIIPLSGTFWKNRGSEAFVALNLLDPKRFYSYEAFKQRDVNYYYEGSKLKEGGLRKGFINEIKHICIRRQFEEVMDDYPEFCKTEFITEMPEYALKVYDEEGEKITAIMNAAAIGGEAGTFKNQAALMQSLMVMRQIVGIAKVPATVELAQDFLNDTNRKLVIFVHHRKCGELIYEQMKTWCAENDIAQPVKITGEMNSIERIEAQDRFNGPHCRLLVASTLAAGEGMNLQTCSDSILHERQWNAPNELQAVKGRFQRIGQKAKHINCIYVHGEGSVDIDLHSIVEKKMVQFHNSMNKGDMEQWSDASMVMQLSQAIADKFNKKRNKK